MSLARYVAPPPVEPEACASCKCMRPECLVPVDERAVPMCWLCAHLVTEHEHVIGATVIDCGCTAEEVYPADVIAARTRVFSTPSESAAEIAITAKYAQRPSYMGKDSDRILAQREARRDRVMRMSLKAP